MTLPHQAQPFAFMLAQHAGSVDCPEPGAAVRINAHGLRDIVRQAIRAGVGGPGIVRLVERRAMIVEHAHAAGPGCQPLTSLRVDGDGGDDAERQAVSRGKTLPGVVALVEGSSVIIQHAEAIGVHGQPGPCTTRRGDAEPFQAGVVNGNRIHIVGQQSIQAAEIDPGVVALVQRRAVVVQQADPTAVRAEPLAARGVNTNGIDAIARQAVGGCETDPGVVSLVERRALIVEEAHAGVMRAEPLVSQGWTDRLNGDGIDLIVDQAVGLAERLPGVIGLIEGGTVIVQDADAAVIDQRAVSGLL